MGTHSKLFNTIQRHTMKNFTILWLMASLASSFILPTDVLKNNDDFSVKKLDGLNDSTLAVMNVPWADFIGDSVGDFLEAVANSTYGESEDVVSLEITQEVTR